MKIAAIVVNWNEATLTVACVQSLAKSFELAKRTKQIQFKIVVVDNASDPRELAALKLELGKLATLQDSIEILATGENLGYAGGCNAGATLLKHWNPTIFWLLNNDIVVDVHAVEHLVDYDVRHPHNAIVGCTVLDGKQPTRILTTGGYRYYKWIGWSRATNFGRNVNEVAMLKLPGKLDYIDGAAMWIQAELIERAGGLKSPHFLYYEELELSLSVMKPESLGWCKNAFVQHIQGASFKDRDADARRVYYAAASAFVFTITHHPIYLPIVVLARLAGVGFRSIINRNPGLFVAALKALAVIKPRTLLLIPHRNK